MRVRLKPSVAKLVSKHRKTLSAADEVNRALTEFYEPSVTKPVLDVESLKTFLGSHNVRRFLRHE